jgi:hypothetical protein
LTHLRKLAQHEELTKVLSNLIMAAQLHVEGLVSEYKQHLHILEERRVAELAQQRKAEEERKIEQEAERMRQWDEDQDLLRRAEEVRLRRGGKVTTEGGKGPEAGGGSPGGRDVNTGDAGTPGSTVCLLLVVFQLANGPITIQGLSLPGSVSEVSISEPCLRRDERFNLQRLQPWALQVFKQW